MGRHYFRFLSFSVLPLLAACNLTSLRSQVEKQVQAALPPPLACTITSPSATVASGDVLSLPITISGGVMPYQLQVVDRKIDVTPSFSVGHVFMNDTGLSAPQTFSITVSDGASTSASCSVTVTVTPPAAPPAALTCSVVASPSAPEVNQPVQLQFRAVGGQGSNTFSSLAIGSGGSITSALQSSGANTATAVAVYTASGTKPITALVTDGGGHSASCSLNLSVRQPRITVTLNPANGVVAAGSPITVSLSASGFAANAALVYYFYSGEAGIHISASGNTATVTVTDQSAHDFVLTVAVTDSNTGDIATGFAHLVFTSTRQPLTCTVSLTARGGTLYPVLPYYYYYYTATAIVPASAGATGVHVTRLDVDGPTYAAYSENATTVAINFFNNRILEPAQKPATVELSIEDNLGRRADCTRATAQVWAY